MNACQQVRSGVYEGVVLPNLLRSQKWDPRKAKDIRGCDKKENEVISEIVLVVVAMFAFSTMTFPPEKGHRHSKHLCFFQD